MSQDDPFASADSERTIIMPSPRGRVPPPIQSPQSPPPATAPIADGVATPPVGINPLTAAANPLLNIVPQLRSTFQHADPQGLRDYLAQNIKAFESRAKASGVAPENVIAARYVLCTLLDETAASTPWGGAGMWAKHSLLVMFHSEAAGGEKFFLLLSKLVENPKANRDLLELMYICLALGFEGRYRIIDNGRSQLDALRERLAQILGKQRGEYERDLSPHWQAASIKRSNLLAVLPLWVTVAAGGLILLTAYLSVSYFINSASDPVFAQIQSIRVKALVAKPAPRPAAKPRLAGFLVNEIRDGLVNVRDEIGRSIVTLRGDGLFTSGSTTISPNFQPLLARIAEALNAVPGQIQITGHTDNQPIRSAQFPSNWHLSQERARSVARLLAEKGVSANRLRAEGRADAEPVAPNDTPVNRARNRRVEITLFVARADG